MNSYALAAMAAIQSYRNTHDGNFPQFIEATAECIEAMGYYYFEFPGNADEVTRVPVVEVGAGDIVFRRVLVRNTDINQQRAEYATAEQFQRIGAKLARAGLLIVEPKESSGQGCCPPFLFYSQIEVWVFGEQAVLREVVIPSDNHLSEGQ